MAGTGTLYQRDFFEWTQAQAQALREAARVGANLPLDWENLAEEIESLGRRDRRELRSRISRVLEHLLKLQFSPAHEPRDGWVETIMTQRAAIQRILKDSPSLRREVGDMLVEEQGEVGRRIGRILLRRGEIAQATIAVLHNASYTCDELLTDWFPDTPHAALIADGAS
jgi:Domain of unknown function DUF29